MSRENEIEEYGDEYIQSYDHNIPTWLKWTYVTLPIWGILWFSLFWNGSWGFMDRGYWHALEVAADTTYNGSFNQNQGDSTSVEILKNKKK